MFSRIFAFSYFLFLFSVLAWAQTGDISSPATPGTGDPSLVPLSDTNVSVRPAAVPTNTADQEGKIKFRTQTILVQVPIVVTDKSGNHIHGLTKEDFHVFENGKEQKVADALKRSSPRQHETPGSRAKAGRVHQPYAFGSAAAHRLLSSLSIPSTLPFLINTLAVAH